MRCPKCRTLTLLPAGPAADAGRLVHCPRCATAWILRPGDAPAASGTARAPMVRRGPLTIEGDFVPTPRPHQRTRASRTGFLPRVVGLALALVAGVRLSSAASARTDLDRSGALR